MSELSRHVEIGNTPPAWLEVVRVARHGYPMSLSPSAWEEIRAAREAVEKIAASSVPHYGINTGLGALCDVVLKQDELQRLSHHTLMSHACGVGSPLRTEQVRAIICCAVINYSHGYSGISPAVVEGLIRLLNEQITPVVPSRGSVGYLTHMAHIGLALIGHGDVDFRGQRMPAKQALEAIGMVPVTLGPKDGLSLVNGTPAMTGLACLALDDAARLSAWADIIGAMSFEALGGQLNAFMAEVTALKCHPGVQQTGDNLRRLLAGSAHLARHKGQRLQDALSLRSMPQVHGACRDQLDHAAKQVDKELNSATDNPLVIPVEDGYQVVSQANPHGASVAMACDLLAIAACEWSSISERRAYRLVTPQANQLPPFLTTESGVKSGMMIAHYSAASLVADNKRLAQPAVTDNFITSGLQEDHLSFGESAALKLDKTLDNAFYVLAIEYLLASQALDLIGSDEFAKGTSLAWKSLREVLPTYQEEHALHLDIEAAYQRLKETQVIDKLLSIAPNLLPSRQPSD
ncbi:HAL/PAL/TAL family ammonia-lyase [Vreelandella titanicae]|uniref:Histidine ammonia-lyase n=1 Tax=Vreelandella titanicae TaxID=664683 RepID=A0A558J2C1_9GAMM|nr:histidine ammonia-lyase [Halomonas titanicae]TVU87799.1 histidine ammonia-lyase [Halomonas titanicae]